MNDQLQAQLSQVLAQIMVSVGEVKDFSVSNLPDIAQQYITYGIWKTGIASVIFFVAIIPLFFVAKSGVKDLRNSEEIGFPKVMFSTFGVVLSMCFFIDNLHSFILVMTAPKVWFILEVKNILS